MADVLYNHTKYLVFHPYLHIFVPGDCIDKKCKQWKKLKVQYLFNEFALASVFRGRTLDALKNYVG
jgi:hypothetical protein